MLKVQLISDMHLEFYRNDRDILDILKKCQIDCDVLVVAGDLATKHAIGKVLKMVSDLAPQVLYVVGNHEFYGSSFTEMLYTIGDAVIKIPNITLLNNSVKTIKGIKFAGTPLWFKWDEYVDSISEGLNCVRDFQYIRNFHQTVGPENEAGVKFLTKTDADVIITHYLPTERCVLPEYAGNACNRFFVCPVLDNQIKNMPKYWLHGHTHGSVDIMCGETRVLCNPYGYPEGVADGPNPGFKKTLIELPT